MRRAFGFLMLVFGVAVVAVGCGGNDGRSMMTGPGTVGQGKGAPTFMSLTPQGGATGVSTATTMSLRFGAAMGDGMEQYVDLHLGDLAGPVVPMSCGWSSDRTTLLCTPQALLAPGAAYVLHLGGGMMTLASQPLDYGQYGLTMGGQWITGGMMGGSHAGGAWGMMGPGWRNSNGSYGMAFSFTTA